MQYQAKYAGKFLFVVAAVAVLGGVVMVLWNLIVPELFFGGRTIDYWHALGLLVLSRILFGGFRGHGAWHARQHMGRWAAMTEEEREQFRSRKRGTCRHRGEHRGERSAEKSAEHDSQP